MGIQTISSYAPQVVRKEPEAKMAKFEKRHLADYSLMACIRSEEGVISRRRSRKFSRTAVFFDLPDLNRKKTHPQAVAHEQAMKKAKIKERKGKVPGPQNKIPAQARREYYACV